MSLLKRKIINPISRAFGSGLSEATAQFKTQISAHGLIPPEEIVADGLLHRFSSSGKATDSAGWYVFYPAPFPGGIFGCWRTQTSGRWFSKSEELLTEAEKHQLSVRIELAQKARDEELRARQEAAALKAQQYWDNAAPAVGHSYLVRKAIDPHGLRMTNGQLLVPLYDSEGKLKSIQFISADGGKRFMAGGQVTGCCTVFGEPKSELVICEGVATGATIAEQTGLPVAIAFSAGNLVAIARIMRIRYPEIRIIMAADNDMYTPNNPGVASARKAAALVRGRLAVPVFPANAEGNPTDFNDLYRIAGPQAVIDTIRASLPVSPDETVWPKARPVLSARPPVMPLHDDLIPNSLRGWITDISSRMGCPPDFLAVAALVAISSLIGARAVIAPKALDDWTVVPVLWGQIVSPPGSLKSPALNESLRPLMRLDSRDRKAWHSDHQQWEADIKLQQMAAEANERRAKSLAASNPSEARALLAPMSSAPEPTLRRRVMNDSTVEKLAEVLVDHPYGLLVYRDELHGLLTSMDKAGQEGSRTFYLQGYDGNQSYTVDRIGRGTQHIPRVCLALLGGIQPGLVDDYVQSCLKSGTGNDGLLQRFSMTVWPDQRSDYVYVDRKPDLALQSQAYAVFERLDQLQPEPTDEPKIWRYTPAAQIRFQQWLTQLETDLRDPNSAPVLLSHLSKYRKLIPALSLVFAMIDTPGSDQLVDEPELDRAIQWGEYLRTHAERMYSVQTGPDNKKADDLRNKLRTNWFDSSSPATASFTPREIALKGWAGLGTSADVRKAAAVLVDHGWLRRAVVSSADAQGRGRPSEQYQIHPDI